MTNPVPDPVPGEQGSYLLDPVPTPIGGNGVGVGDRVLCKVARLVADADPSWRSALTNSDDWSAGELARALHRTVSATLIRDHRRGECSCTPNSR